MKAGPALCCVVAALALASPAWALPSSQHKVFLTSARENKTLSRVTLPLYQGTSHGGPVWFVVTDASTRDAATRYGANYSPKLAAAANTSAVQLVTFLNGAIDFPGTVDFSPNRQVEPGPYMSGDAGTELGLPATVLKAGAVGDASYSPLIQLPDGTVLNASHVANGSGQADKAHHLVKPVPPSGVGRVTFEETVGFFEHHTIHYFSTDASAEAAAVLENVTFAPKLAGAPGGDPAQENLGPTPTSRAGIIAFSNGQTGLANPQRQGLNSVIDDGPQHVTATSGPVPMNIIQSVPDGLKDSAYSPLWDAHITRWNPQRFPKAADRRRQTSFTDVQALAAKGDVTNPMGGPWGRSGPIPDCPIVSTDGPSEMVFPSALVELRTRTAKSARRIELTVESTEPVTGLRVTLRRGTRTAASGSLARLDGAAKVTAKASTVLSPGRYRVTLTAKDLLGQAVKSTARLRLRR